MKRNKNFKLNNVFIASYGYCERYGHSDFKFSKSLEEELSPYVENDYLKTDIKSLSEVAKILDNYTGDVVVVNGDGTITFYNTDY